MFIPPSFFSANLTDNTLTTNLTGTHFLPPLSFVPSSPILLFLGTVSTFDIDTEEGITYSFSAVTSWTYTTNPQTITYSLLPPSLFPLLSPYPPLFYSPFSLMILLFHLRYSTFDGSLFANGNLIYFDEAITMDGVLFHPPFPLFSPLLLLSFSHLALGCRDRPARLWACWHRSQDLGVQIRPRLLRHLDRYNRFLVLFLIRINLLPSFLAYPCWM